MSGMVIAVITILAWGAWLAPSQTVPIKNQQTRTFYVTLGVLVLAFLVALAQGFKGLTPNSIYLPFVGGLIWSTGSLFAFVSANQLGMAKAFGIWAPVNIVVSIIWGIVLFREFLRASLFNILLAALSVVVIIVGVVMIVLAGRTSDTTDKGGRAFMVGLMGAVGAGIGFGSYFVPIRISAVSMWVAVLPLAVGMFVGSCILALISHASLRLVATSHYGRVLTTGFLWAIGNYGALKMMELIGTGRGFTITQLCVVVNALLGIFWEKNPRPGTRAANLTFAGVAIATIGGCVLGTLKS